MNSRLLRLLWSRLVSFVDLREHIDVDAAAISIRNNIAFRGPNMVILFCAIIIASVGLNVNSIPVIIGAMLISPLMAPIVGFGMALGTNDTKLLHISLRNLGVMVGISILASTLYFLVSPLDMEHPTELLARTNPTIYDVLIALFGGFAGILETSRKEKGTVMSGVAIATALMPPLCTVGYGLASLNPQFFVGACYLFFINMAFIALAAFVGTKYLGYRQVSVADPAKRKKSRIIILVFLLVLIVPSIISGLTVIRETNFSRSANAFVRENKNVGRSYVYDHAIHTDKKPYTLELYIAGGELTADNYALLYKAAEKYGIQRNQLLFHQEAANQNVVLDENVIFHDMIRQHEEREQEYAAHVKALQNQVDSLQSSLVSLSVPSEQVAMEIKAQYPAVKEVVLARADANKVVVLLTTSGQPFSAAERNRMREWLQIRLNTEVLVWSE